MKNLKISAKLWLGFGVVLVMIILLGTLSLFSIGRINKVVTLYATKTLPNTGYIWEIRYEMVSIERYLTEAIATESRDVKLDMLKKADEEGALLLERIDRYKQNARTDPALIEEYVKRLESAAQYRQQITDILNLPESKENDALALEIFENQYVPAFDSATEALTKVSDVVYQLADKQKADAEVTFGTVKSAVFFITLFIAFLAVLMVALIRRSIITPVRAIEQMANDLSEGRMNSNVTYVSKDEFGSLVQTMGTVRQTISMLVDRLQKLIVDFDKGITDSRVDETVFKGEYQSLAQGVNELCSTLINDNLLIMDAFGALGNGDFNATLTQLPGQKAVANERFDVFKANIKALHTDLSMLIDSAAGGKLDTRIDAAAYKDGWQEIVTGLNNLLAAVNKPIEDANQVLEQLARGQFDVRIQNAYKGAFAEMMLSLNSMVQTIGSYIAEITQMLQVMAEGDLRSTINRDYVGEFGQIKDSINHIVNTMQETIQNIIASADNVRAGARQISESAMDLASGASNQAGAVEQLSASISVINEQSTQNTARTKEANQLSQRAIAGAENGRKEMQQMLDSMETIKKSSHDIANIIKVIDDIAFQTNLLALNAAVEAARAGEHGRGFSVVAEEVRALAGRSQEAAKNTESLIDQTIQNINAGSEIATTTADALNTIVNDINSISSIIEDIDQSSANQADSIAQITAGINQISEVVQSNSSTSEESAAASQELSSQSELLATMVESFKV